MKKIDWENFKSKTEKKFENAIVYNNTWGYQIQPGTKWNSGLSKEEIILFEKRLGFEFPVQYKLMLQHVNGFAKDEIFVDPDGKSEDKFSRQCYKYPEDWEKVQWVIEDVTQYIEVAKDVLRTEGFPYEGIEGFIPLYAHRALVVFENKDLSPVLSIWGNDIIIYGKSLYEYWCHEFYLEA